MAPYPGPLTVFTVVDASTDPDTLLETLEDVDDGEAYAKWKKRQRGWP